MLKAIHYIGLTGRMASPGELIDEEMLTAEQVARLIRIGAVEICERLAAGDSRRPTISTDELEEIVEDPYKVLDEIENETVQKIQTEIKPGKKRRKK